MDRKLLAPYLDDGRRRFPLARQAAGVRRKVKKTWEACEAGFRRAAAGGGGGTVLDADPELQVVGG